MKSGRSCCSQNRMEPKMKETQGKRNANRNRQKMTQIKRRLSPKEVRSEVFRYEPKKEINNLDKFENVEPKQQSNWNHVRQPGTEVQLGSSC